MSKSWYPIIDFSLCDECTICISHCSHGVYDKTKKLPAVINPLNCVEGCRGCQSKCPQKAISYFGDNGSVTNVGCCCN